MRIRIASELQDYLDKDFGWRLREIDQLRDTVRRTSSYAQKAFIRAGVAMLYAHWEGFVKTGAESFLGFVSCQGKNYRELKNCFILHGLGSELEKLNQSKSFVSKLGSLQFILENLDKRAKFSAAGKINAKSNLNSEVFESISAAIGIDPERYKTRYVLIDEQLLKARNKIAHGEWVDLDQNLFSSLTEETLVLMRWFKTDIENTVVTRSYLAKNISASSQG